MSASITSENPDVVVVSERLVVETKRLAKTDDGCKMRLVAAKMRVSKDKSKVSAEEDNEDRMVINR